MRDNLTKIRGLIKKIEAIWEQTQDLDNTDRHYLRGKVLSILVEDEDDTDDDPETVQ